MVCSGMKTKLLTVGTQELRNSKLLRNNLRLEINVDGCKVVETESERLLGLIMNNVMSWKHHLYGNEETKGLVDKLSHRASLISKLSKIMPKHRLKTFAEGIFFSVLNYGIGVYGNVWGIPNYDEQSRNSPAFTKEDNRRLQILVNKVLRLLTGLDKETSVIELHEKSRQLSVQQRCAFFSTLQVYKTLKNKKPMYHLDCFESRNSQRATRSKPEIDINYRLSISRCSFFYRGAKLYNLLPTELMNMDKAASFKKALKAWTVKNIPLIPP